MIPYRFVELSPALVSPDGEHWFVKPEDVPMGWFMEVIRLPVMTWQEHAQRSLYAIHMDPDCWPHVMEAAVLVPSETMARMNCARCNGSVWVAYHPAHDQGASTGDLVQLVEGLVNSG